MDGFALARRKARELRARLSSGSVSAYDVVRQALAEEGLGVLEQPRDGVILAGDDAQLRRDFSQVVVRNDLGEDERAMLLAHELGHKILHRPQEVCELAQCEGAGSRALSRVESYGPRERRELQANVFAREFVLPREAARRFFLIERLTAPEIAVRAGMPLRDVRRQLLDSLLRPDDLLPAPGVVGRLVELDDSQRRAVDHDGRALLVEAGPGSGKTRTLVSRIERRLEQGVPPSQILALTFSNKAAAELCDRVAERRPDDAVEVWGGTFHAFGLEVMRQFYDRLNLAPTIRLVSPAQAVEMLEDSLPLLGLRHFHDLRNPGERLKEMLRPISRAKDELVGPERFRELAQLGLRRAEEAAATTAAGPAGARKEAEKALVAAERTFEASVVYEVYEQALRDKGCVDFADLVLRPTLLMESDAEVRATLQERHREILVDEYQDVNRACARMLRALHGPRSTLWVVGDARQSIYRFRGASSRNMGLFESDFEGASRTPLEWNYRSTLGLVGITERFAGAMDARLAASPDPPTRLPYKPRPKRAATGSSTKVMVGGDDACEAALLVREIKALEAAGVPLARQTVLARTNARLDALAAHLASKGIPALHLGSFFEREEVRDLLSVLALLSEPNGAALARVAASREVSVHASDIGLAIDHARGQGAALAQILLSARSVPGLSARGAESLSALGRRLAGLTPASPACVVAATWLLERSDYLRDLAGRDGIEAELSRAALWQAMEFLEQSEPDGRPLSAREALRRVRTVVLMADDRDLRDPNLPSAVDAVRLMTVHAAKGLEFGAVHLVGLHDRGFPLGFQTDVCQVPPGIEDGRDPRTAHSEEEDCAFFVAISRAEDHLRLYRTERAAVKPRKASPYLSDLGPLREEHLAAVAAAPPARKPTNEAIAIEGLTLQDLRDYEQCPLRLAYRHRLSIRGRRYEGPFLKASGVLYELLDELGTIVDAGVPAAEAVEAAFERAWAGRGPVGHGLEDEYKRLVRGNLAAALRLADGHRPAPTRMVPVPLAGGHLVVPAPLLSGAGRVRTARYIELGKGDPKRARELRAGMLHAAAVIAAEGDVAVEVSHVSDGATYAIVRSAKEAAEDIRRVGQILAAVREGYLAPKPELRVCVRCAHFFSCPATGGPREG